MLDAERAHAMAVHSAEPGQRRRMPVDDCHDPAMGRHVGQQLFDMRSGVDEAALSRPLCRGPAGVEPVGRGDGEQPHVAAVLGHQPDRLDCLRHNRARVGDHDLAIRTGRALPIGAVDDRLPQLRRHRALDLLDRPRRQAQIDRAAGFVAQPVALGAFFLGIALDVVESKRENNRQLVDECRLEGCEPILGEPDQRRCDRLVRAAFGRQRDARGRRRQNEAGILIAGVVERIEPALNERVVERADRDQPLAVYRV